MILFLDDDPMRAVMAHNRMSIEARNETLWCQTAEETIQSLWDYRDVLTTVSLDHDLGGREFDNTKREDCGMEVIRFLEKMSKKEPEEFKKLANTKFIIHTWNGHAGPIMKQRLEKLGLRTEYIPFGM